MTSLVSISTQQILRYVVKASVIKDWEHPPTSNAVGWVKHAGNSPVAYLQFGDGPGQYAEPIFRQIIGNAITWASSKEAHDWAQNRFQESGTFA